jgi:hypothetical protein
MQFFYIPQQVHSTRLPLALGQKGHNGMQAAFW